MKTKRINETIVEIDGERYVKEDSQGWLTIPELSTKDYEFQVEVEVHDKNKSWDELELSKRESELLTYDQCVFLANHKDYSKKLNMDGSSIEDDFFIKQPFDLSRKNGRVAVFDVYSVYANLYCWINSGNSYSALGVRFVRKIKRNKDKVNKNIIEGKKRYLINELFRAEDFKDD